MSPNAVKSFSSVTKTIVLCISWITASFQDQFDVITNPKSKTPTITVSHAVKEEPGGICAAVLDEGHVVTGFDAQHSEQLHPLAGKTALPPRTFL